MGDDPAREAPFAPWCAPEPSAQIHFFISFEETQYDDAKWVNETLKNSGYRTHFYPEHNSAGNDYQYRMDEMEYRATHVLAVFSDAYFAQESHAYGEARRANDRDPSGNLRRLLWVSFKSGIDVPARYRTLIGLPLYTLPQSERRVALLEYAESALTGVSFGYTPIAMRGDEIAVHDREPRPWAAWLPSAWDPLGPDPLPAVAERSLRVDALWLRDRSPFRAVLADWPGADLADSLNQATDLLPGDVRPRRSWHHLGSLHGREQMYVDRDSVLTALQPPATAGGSIGIVTGFVLAQDIDIRHAVDSAAAGFRRLSELLPDEALVLRVEGGYSQDVNWVAAAVARQLRDGGPPLDLASRLRTSDRNTHRPGGGTSDAVVAVLRRVRARRQELGADVLWRLPASDGESVAGSVAVGADTAEAVVEELNGGVALPEGLTEYTFLRHIRDHLPAVWVPLMRGYAARRVVPAWFIGLEVASEWPDDLDAWVAVLATERNSPLHRPDLVLGRMSAEVADRLLLALHHHPGLQQRWLAETDTPLARVLRAGLETLDGMAPDAVRRMLRVGLVAPIASDPKQLHFWVALAMSAEVDLAAVHTSGIGVDVDEVLAWRPPAQTDPVAAKLLDYYRHLVRPYGAAS